MEADFEHGRRLSRHDDIDAYMISLFGGEFAEYRRRWQATTARERLPEETLPFPLHLSVEVADTCNLSCVFCYRHFNKRYASGKTMPVTVFEDLLHQARNLGVEALEIGHNGEALTHPEIVPILGAAARAGFLDRIVPTNGLLMRGEILEAILDSATRVHVSIDAASEETYRKVRGGDFTALRRNIDAFLSLRAKRGGGAPIFRVSFIVMDQNRHEIADFARQWRDVADVVDFQGYVDFFDLENLDGDFSEDFCYCPDPYRMLVVRAGGDIFPCCSFYGWNFPLGTFPDTTLSEAWSGKEMSGLRAALLAGQPPRPCRKCRDLGEV